MTLTLAVLALTSFATASTLRTEIEAMNKQVHKSMMKKDIAGFAKVVKAGVTKDFKYTEMGRTMSFDEMIAQMKMGFGMMDKMISADTKIITLKENGSSAVCTSRHTIASTIIGPDKKSHKLMMIGLSKESYKKIGGKWKMTTMDWKNEKTTMDGVEVDPMTMQPIKK